MATRPSRKRDWRYGKVCREYKEKCRATGNSNCYFCGESIDFDLHYHNKWAFTVQHIVPVSRGGAELDEDNFAPAHRSCNAREGNRLAGTRTEDGDMTLGPALKRSRVW